MKENLLEISGLEIVMLPEIPSISLPLEPTNRDTQCGVTGSTVTWNAYIPRPSASSSPSYSASNRALCKYV